MDLHPPIHERTDEQIKDIMRRPKHYRGEVVELAEKEFYKRGFTKQERKKLLHAGGAKEKYRKRVDEKRRDNESYFDGFWWWRNPPIFLWIVIWPFTVIMMTDQHRDGRDRVFTESALFVIIGIVLWCVILVNLKTMSA